MGFFIAAIALALFLYVMSGGKKEQVSAKTTNSKIPIGTKTFELTVRDTLTTLKLSNPWISFSLFNNTTSTGSVYCKVNDLDSPITNEAPIGAGETNNWDFDYPIIKRLYLQAESGTIAYVKVFAEVGRWE